MSSSTNGRVRLYVGMHDGVCTLTGSNGSQSWQQGEVTPLAHAASRLAPSPSAPDRAYLVAYEAGVFRTDDGGRTWRRLVSYPTGYAHSVAVHPANPDLLFVGSEPAAVFRSQDGGESWEECLGFREVPEASEWDFHSATRLSHVRDLRMAPHDPDWLYAGIEVGGVVRSRDGGRSWRQLPGTDPDVHSLSFSPARPTTVYAATATGPYRSDDAGDSWEPIHDGLELRYTVPILPSPDDPERVLVAVGNNAGRGRARAYLSTNAGREWRRVESLGTEDDMVIAFAWDPVDSRLVYAGTDGGKLFVSADRGDSWEPMAVSLPSVAVGALAAVSVA